MNLTRRIYVLWLILMLFGIGAMAKSGIIPTYRSFACWMSDNDTLYHENRSMLFESASGDGTVIVRVRHQDWNNLETNDRKENTMAPWHDCISKFT